MRSFRSRSLSTAKPESARLGFQPRLQRAKAKPPAQLPPSLDTFSRHLVIMVELTPNGTGAALNRYRFAARTIYQRLAGDRRWQTTLAISPVSAVTSPVWPAAATRMAQGGGDIAERIERILNGMPPGPVVIIGTDAGNVKPADVWAAFEALGEADAVLGPGAGGGYWLIGAKRRPSPKVAFNASRWAGMATRAAAKRSLTACRIEELPPLRAADTSAAQVRRILAPV